MRLVDFSDDRFQHATAGPVAPANFKMKNMMAETNGRGRTDTSRMSGAAAFLAYAGALPLVVMAVMIVKDPQQSTAFAQGMSAYGALLLAFFGGVRWGVAIMQSGVKNDGPSFRALIGGALPLAAAAPLFMPFADTTKFVYIIFALTILLIDDLNATGRGAGAPGWYLAVRAPLSVLMMTAYFVAMAAMGGV